MLDNHPSRLCRETQSISCDIPEGIRPQMNNFYHQHHLSHHHRTIQDKQPERLQDRYSLLSNFQERPQAHTLPPDDPYYNQRMQMIQGYGGPIQSGYDNRAPLQAVPAVQVIVPSSYSAPVSYGAVVDPHRGDNFQHASQHIPNAQVPGTMCGGQGGPLPPGGQSGPVPQMTQHQISSGNPPGRSLVPGQGPQHCMEGYHTPTMASGNHCTNGSIQQVPHPGLPPIPTYQTQSSNVPPSRALSIPPMQCQTNTEAHTAIPPQSQCNHSNHVGMHHSTSAKNLHNVHPGSSHIMNHSASTSALPSHNHHTNHAQPDYSLHGQPPMNQQPSHPHAHHTHHTALPVNNPHSHHPASHPNIHNHPVSHGSHAHTHHTIQSYPVHNNYQNNGISHNHGMHGSHLHHHSIPQQPGGSFPSHPDNTMNNFPRSNTEHDQRRHPAVPIISKMQGNPAPPNPIHQNKSKTQYDNNGFPVNNCHLPQEPGMASPMSKDRLHRAGPQCVQNSNHHNGHGAHTTINPNMHPVQHGQHGMHMNQYPSHQVGQAMNGAYDVAPAHHSTGHYAHNGATHLASSFPAQPHPQHNQRVSADHSSRIQSRFRK